MTATVDVEVVLAWPRISRQRRLRLPTGSSASEAVRSSMLLDGVPGRLRRCLTLSVFGEAIDPDTPVRQGDRIELLRPLTVDPREARRRRARLRARDSAT
jgi:putative ubiquitin-RnfH superfamily antitoxin RatB of RatAB toxin-antitoxin module